MDPHTHRLDPQFHHLDRHSLTRPHSLLRKKKPTEETMTTVTDPTRTAAATPGLAPVSKATPTPTTNPPLKSWLDDAPAPTRDGAGTLKPHSPATNSTRNPPLPATTHPSPEREPAWRNFGKEFSSDCEGDGPAGGGGESNQKDNQKETAHVAPQAHQPHRNHRRGPGTYHHVTHHTNITDSRSTSRKERGKSGTSMTMGASWSSEAFGVS